MAIFLSILVAILWACFDAIRKKSIQFISEINALFLIVISQFFLFLFFLLFSDFQIDIYSYYIYGIFLIFLNLISMYMFLKVLKKGEISTYIPMLSFTPLFSALYSRFILTEKLQTSQYFGIFLVIFGALLLYSKSFKFKYFLKPSMLKFNNSNKNLYFIIIVSLIWSLTPVLDKQCLKHTDPYMHGFIQSAGMLIIIPIILNYKELKYNFNFKTNILLIGLVLIGFLASLVQLIALKYNLVAVLESLKRGIGISLSLFFGYYFFNEKITYKKFISVFIMIIGIFNIINFTDFT